MNKTDALHEGLKKMLNYLPMIYNQRSASSENTGEIIIKYPYSSIPDNALLFVLPIFPSLATGNKLTIKYATVSQDGSAVSYHTTKTYNIMVEGTDGTKRSATTGDIVANRLCMFRFITNNSTDIILCNNPIYNNLQCSSLYISNEAVFDRLPQYRYKKNGTEFKTDLVTAESFNALKERVTELEKRLQIGTKSPEEFFGSNQNLPENTIYFQVEE